MLNPSTVLIFFHVAVFILTVILLTATFPHRHNRAVRWLIVLSLSFCLISFCTLNIYVNESLEAKEVFSRLRFLGFSLLTPSWLLFLVESYGGWKWIRNRVVTWIILVPGLINFAFSLSPEYQNLVVLNFSERQVLGVNVVEFQTGAWFPFYYSWSFSLILLSWIYVIQIFAQSKSRNRRLQITALTLGSVLAAAIDFYCVATNSPMRWLMLSSATFLFTLFGIWHAIARHGLLSVTALAKDHVFQELPDPVLILDLDQCLHSANRAALGLLKLPTKAIGKPITGFLDLAKISPGEQTYTDINAQQRTFQVVSEPIGAQSGDSVLGQIVYFREVTLQKQIEERLNQNIEVKARLLAMVAHDLAGNLEGQSMMTMDLQKDPHLSAEGFQRRMGLLTDSTLASQGFIANIMSWVRTQGDSFSPIMKDFEWNQLIRDCIEDLSPQSEMRKIQLRFTASPSPVLAVGDSAMLASVLRNLMSNALNASTPGQAIDIELLAGAEAVSISIDDKGRGIGESDLTQLLHQSAQLNLRATTASRRGFGIGIPLSRHFVRLHDGDFHIHSVPNEGTQVKVRIPLRT